MTQNLTKQQTATKHKKMFRVIGGKWENLIGKELVVDRILYLDGVPATICLKSDVDGNCRMFDISEVQELTSCNCTCSGVLLDYYLTMPVYKHYKKCGL